mgnify:CR=1 FL=1
MSEVSAQVSVRLMPLFASNRLGSSYIFSGNNVEAKWLAAKRLAQFLNCEASSRPCLSCTPCTLIEQERYHGLIKISCEEESIKIETIRELRRKVAYGADTYWMIVYLEQAHRLTAGAGNAILKTLEEPPEHVVIVLDVPNPYRVLPTIRSRSHQISFGYTAHQTFENEMLANIPMDKFLDYVQNNNLGQLLNFAESGSLDRVKFSSELMVFQDYLLRSYISSPDSRLLKVMTHVQRTVRYLERPVNATTNWVLLLMTMKEIYAK